MKKGISLIVLVITIIVIIILSSAVILSLSNNNPISQANEATFKANVSAYKSELSMAIASEYLNQRTLDLSTCNKSTWNGGSIIGTIKEYIPSIRDSDAKIFAVSSGQLVYVGNNVIEENWLANVGVYPDGASYAAINIGELATRNSTIDGLAPKYNNPIIPKGFKAINDGTTWPTGWNDGLVIEDKKGNQFVWVPVDGTNVKYEKWCTDGADFDDPSLVDDTLPLGVSNEQYQITKYGGFYIGRFEAAHVSYILVSKKSISPWTSISYIDSKVQAEYMYDTDEVKSGLLTGKQWDTLMKWIQNSGKIVEDNSTAWGNYLDSVSPANVSGFGTKQVTGYSEFWKAKNIYDVAGNVREWVNERYGANVVRRGGEFGNTGIAEAAAYRSASSAPTYISSATAFRVALYIM